MVTTVVPLQLGFQSSTNSYQMCKEHLGQSSSQKQSPLRHFSILIDYVAHNDEADPDGAHDTITSLAGNRPAIK